MMLLTSANGNKERTAECRIVYKYERTLAILARRNDRTRNLNRSSSVWMTMSLKLALGSIFPVCSSTSSICRFTSAPNQPLLSSHHIRFVYWTSLTGPLAVPQFRGSFHGLVVRLRTMKDWIKHTHLPSYPPLNPIHQASRPRQHLRRDALSDPRTRQLLEVAALLRLLRGRDVGEDVIDVHWRREGSMCARGMGLSSSGVKGGQVGWLRGARGNVTA